MDASTYIAYLLSEPRRVSCVRASDVTGVSHDEVNRFLLSGQFSGKDLFEAVKGCFPLQGGVLSLDDTVLDKPFSAMDISDLVDRFWSGRHHCIVVGVNLITMHYTAPDGSHLPVNFRLYRKSDGKSNRVAL